jgi:hypothetical protein
VVRSALPALCQLSGDADARVAGAAVDALGEVARVAGAEGPALQRLHAHLDALLASGRHDARALLDLADSSRASVCLLGGLHGCLDGAGRARARSRRRRSPGRRARRFRRRSRSAHRTRGASAPGGRDAAAAGTPSATGSARAGEAGRAGAPPLPAAAARPGRAGARAQRARARGIVCLL